MRLDVDYYISLSCALQGHTPVHAESTLLFIVTLSSCFVPVLLSFLTNNILKHSCQILLSLIDEAIYHEYPHQDNRKLPNQIEPSFDFHFKTPNFDTSHNSMFVMD